MGMNKKDKAALLAKMRKNQEKKGWRDPLEWRPKYKDDEVSTFRAYVLRPLFKGEDCIGKDGNSTTCPEDWDMWHFQHGHHFVDKKLYECPRVRGEGDCPMCDMGFDLMRDVDEKEIKRNIANEWLSREAHAVNLYFPDHKDNPEELRGKVLWWNMPNAIYKQCVACVSREDAGAEDDPRPFGLFFDEDDAYAIIIELKEKSGYNNYDDSRMLYKSGPIADDDEIEDILAKRIDLPRKFDEPNVEDLQKLVDKKLEKVSEGGGFDEDEETSKTKNESKSEKEISKTKKADPESEEELETKESPADPKPEAEAEVEEEKSEAKEEKKAEAKEESDSDDDELDPDMKALLAELNQ